MAYFRKRGSSWYFTVDIGKDLTTGERKQFSKGGFKTKKEAQLAAADVMKEVNDGSFVKESNISFKQYAEEWLVYYTATHNLKPHTVDIRKYAIKRMHSYFSNGKISDITKKKYQDMLIDLMNRGYATGTISSTHSVASLIFQKATDDGIIKINPAERATIPKKVKPFQDSDDEDLPKYLEKEELKLFLNTAKKHCEYKDYVTFLVLAYTGVRIGELTVLKWKDIDFENKTISITKTVYNGNATKITTYKIQSPKTKSSKRIIEVDDLVIQALLKLRSEQNIIKMAKRNNYHDEDFVFARTGSYAGYPEYRLAVSRKMKRLLKNAGLNTGLSLHSLRHTHTSLLAEAKVSLEVIMERLGHKDDTTTRNIYLHVTKTAKREAVEKFSNLMNN